MITKREIDEFILRNNGLIVQYIFNVLFISFGCYFFYEWLFAINDAEINIGMRNAFFACFTGYWFICPNDLDWHINNQNSKKLHDIKDSDERVKFILNGGIDKSMRKSKQMFNLINVFFDGLKIKYYFIYNWRFLTGKQNRFHEFSFDNCGISDRENYRYKNFENTSFDEILKKLSLTEDEFNKVFEEVYGMKFTSKMKPRFEIVYDAHPEKFNKLFLFKKLNEKLEPKTTTTTKKKVVKI